MTRLLPVTLILFGAVSAYSTPLTFTPGDLFWASRANPVSLYEISGPGSYTGASPFAILSSTGSLPGQIAFKPDLTVAYVSIYSTNQILAVTPNGTTSVFATGITKPTGLVWSTDGRLMAASYQDGKVFDITAGGSFTSAAAYASGISNPRYMLQTDAGILVASYGSGKIINLGSGGNLSSATAFAHGLNSPYDIVSFNNKLYVTTVDNKVIDITAGGNMAGKPSYATGRKWAALATWNGKLYASTDSTVTPAGIWDITSGGSFSSTAAWASNLPGAGDTLFDFVPGLPAQSGTSGGSGSPIPEANTSVLLGCGLLLLAAGRARARR